MTPDLPRKALSVRQPWAWAIVHAGKDVENRSLGFLRGLPVPPVKRIAIHAAKGMTRAEYEEAAEFMATLGVVCPLPDALTRGAIVGAATVRGATTRSTSPWFFGPVGLVLDAAAILRPAIPARGALGFFDWRPGGTIEKPKPWMRAWPDGRER